MFETKALSKGWGLPPSADTVLGPLQEDGQFGDESTTLGGFGSTSNNNYSRPGGQNVRIDAQHPPVHDGSDPHSCDIHVQPGSITTCLRDGDGLIA